MTPPASKAELLARIHAAHQQLEARVARLTPAQLAEPNIHGEWAIKDDLAHVSWWEQRMINILESALRGEKSASLAQSGETIEAAVDRTNEQIFAASRSRTVEDILVERKQSFAKVIAMIEALPEADIADPSRIDAVLGSSFLQLIAGDTYEHYEEHGEIIQRWLEHSKQGEQP
jgi:hypothetical protein